MAAPDGANIGRLIEAAVTAAMDAHMAQCHAPSPRYDHDEPPAGAIGRVTRYVHDVAREAALAAIANHEARCHELRDPRCPDCHQPLLVVSPACYRVHWTTDW
ncbi:MAG: hypothetical protein JO057_23005 [Chloroflexi bacterium]|nr:hypothetical protein [Chloroflexota bacterium]